MKRLLSLSLLALMLAFSACQEESSLIAPEIDQEIGSAGGEPNWIALPDGEAMTLNKDLSVGQLVYGNQETLLEINTNYAGGPHGWISITANARFLRNSFVGERFITMSINDEFGCATFSPSGTFLIPVIYNITIQGVDLSGVNPDDVDFYYMAADGSYYRPKYDRLYVEPQSGKLQVINAQLPHFSRYGFAN